VETFLMIKIKKANCINKSMRPLHNSSIRHSGLDPESMKYLIILDSGFRRNDKIAGFMQLCKGLSMIPDAAWIFAGNIGESPWCVKAN